MAFADALDLRTAVVEAVGTASVADVWPRLVSLAEARLNRELRTRWQIKEAVLNDVNLPDDYVEALSLDDNLGSVPITVPEIKSALNNAVFPATLTYYAKLPTLSADLSASNWLLAQYPDVYLYACASEAAKYLREPEAAAQYEQLLGGALGASRRDDFTSRYAAARVDLSGVTR